ncbi:hypothetical protein HK101_001206 [Irineochytrium annulatum]|nr:hypothetical protein HK101_001206 [Irineochytrium annulatum]
MPRTSRQEQLAQIAALTRDKDDLAKLVGTMSLELARAKMASAGAATVDPVSNAEMETRQEQLATSYDQITELQTALAASEEQVEAGRVEVARLEEEIALARERNAARKGKKAVRVKMEDEAAAGSHALEIQTLRDQLAASQDQLAASQEQLAASQNQVATLQTRLAASEERVAAGRAELDRVKHDREEAAAALRKVTEDATALEYRMQGEVDRAEHRARPSNFDEEGVDNANGNASANQPAESGVAIPVKVNSHTKFLIPITDSYGRSFAAVDLIKDGYETWTTVMRKGGLEIEHSLERSSLRNALRRYVEENPDFPYVPFGAKRNAPAIPKGHHKAFVEYMKGPHKKWEAAIRKKERKALELASGTDE